MSINGQDEKKLFAEYKKRAIEKLNRFLASPEVSEEKRIVLSSGWRTFTLEDILKEVKAETEYGRDFIEIYGKPNENMFTKEAK